MIVFKLMSQATNQSYSQHKNIKYFKRDYGPRQAEQQLMDKVAAMKRNKQILDRHDLALQNDYKNIQDNAK